MTNLPDFPLVESGYDPQIVNNYLRRVNTIVVDLRKKVELASTDQVADSSALLVNAERVSQKYLSDAQEKAEKIVAEAQEKAESLTSAAKEQARLSAEEQSSLVKRSQALVAAAEAEAATLKENSQREADIAAEAILSPARDEVGKAQMMVDAARGEAAQIVSKAEAEVAQLQAESEKKAEEAYAEKAAEQEARLAAVEKEIKAKTLEVAKMEVYVTEGVKRIADYHRQQLAEAEEMISGESSLASLASTESSDENESV